MENQNPSMPLSSTQKALEEAKKALEPLLEWYRTTLQDPQDPHPFFKLSPKDQETCIAYYLESTFSGSALPIDATAKSLGEKTQQQFVGIISQTDVSKLTPEEKHEFFYGGTTIWPCAHQITIKPPQGHTVTAWIEKVNYYNQCVQNHKAALRAQQCAAQMKEVLASGGFDPNRGNTFDIIPKSNTLGA
jgi:hypothetical protein